MPCRKIEQEPELETIGNEGISILNGGGHCNFHWKRPCFNETWDQYRSLEPRFYFPGKKKRLESGIRGCLASLSIPKEPVWPEPREKRSVKRRVHRDNEHQDYIGPCRLLSRFWLLFWVTWKAWRVLSKKLHLKGSLSLLFWKKQKLLGGTSRIRENSVPTAIIQKRDDP